MFVWLEGPTSGRVEWRSTCLENGDLSLTLTGLTMMQEWSVASWATSDLVKHTYSIASILTFFAIYFFILSTTGEIGCGWMQLCNCILKRTSVWICPLL